MDCAVEPVLSPVRADQPFRAAFVCTFSCNSLLNGRKSLRKKLNDANQGPDLHSVHQKQQIYGIRFGLSPPVMGPICPGCQEYPVALIELRSTMALRVQGGWGELLLDLQVIRVTYCKWHPRVNFLGRTLTLPVCLYSVECNIVPFGCLF